MKTISTSLLALIIVLFAFTGCVDNDYDLSDVNSDNIGLGDSETIISAPIGDIVLSLDDILTDFTRATQEYTLTDQNIESTIALDEGWITDQVKNTLTSGGGTIVVSASCDVYPEGVPQMTLQLWFDNIALFDDSQVINSQNTSITSQELDSDEVNDIVNASQLRYSIYFAEKTFSCDFEDVENLVIKLSITKKGPIVL
ncbi:MAG: hypothetical protein R3Y49_06970 [Rikenellaceae bacterium]